MTAETVRACKKLYDEEISEYDRGWNDACDAMANYVDRMKGKWQDYKRERWIYARCCKCGAVCDTKTNYCPNCGAEMEE